MSSVILGIDFGNETVRNVTLGLMCIITVGNLILVILRHLKIQKESGLISSKEDEASRLNDEINSEKRAVEELSRQKIQLNRILDKNLEPSEDRQKINLDAKKSQDEFLYEMKKSAESTKESLSDSVKEIFESFKDSLSKIQKDFDQKSLLAKKAESIRNSNSSEAEKSKRISEASDKIQETFQNHYSKLMQELKAVSDSCKKDFDQEKSLIFSKIDEKINSFSKICEEYAFKQYNGTLKESKVKEAHEIMAAGAYQRAFDEIIEKESKLLKKARKKLEDDLENTKIALENEFKRLRNWEERKFSQEKEELKNREQNRVNKNFSEEETKSRSFSKNEGNRMNGSYEGLLRKN